MKIGTFCDVLAIIFIVLKLVGIVHWSWWWVLSPIWLQILVLGLIVMIVVGLKESK